LEVGRVAIERRQIVAVLASHVWRCSFGCSCILAADDAFASLANAATNLLDRFPRHCRVVSCLTTVRIVGRLEILCEPHPGRIQRTCASGKVLAGRDAHTVGIRMMHAICTNAVLCSLSLALQCAIPYHRWCSHSTAHLVVNVEEYLDLRRAESRAASLFRRLSIASWWRCIRGHSGRLV